MYEESLAFNAVANTCLRSKLMQQSPTNPKNHLGPTQEHGMKILFQFQRTLIKKRYQYFVYLTRAFYFRLATKFDF